MRIKDIEIEGYKSILNEHLAPSDLTVLIGKNNSGKSNVIDALADFKEYFDKDDPGGEWFKSRKYKGGSAEIALGFHFILNTEEHEVLLKSVDRDIRSTYQEENWLREVRAYRNFREEGKQNDILVKIKDEWVNAYDLESQEKFEDYFANEAKRLITQSLESWRFAAPFRKPDLEAPPAHIDKMSESGDNLIRALESLRSSPRYDVFDQISDAYVDIMENVTDLRIEYDPATSNRYTIIVEEDGFEERFKASEISSGSLEILVLLTRLYSASEETDLLAIEEPELHLHPGAEKKIFDIITNLLGAQGPQIIVTTHSEVFVDESRVDNIITVKREKDTELRGVQAQEGNYLDILGYNNSDLVQSDAVAFVEGRSDKVILEQMSQILGKPLSEHGIELVVGRGDQIKRDAEPITRVLEQLGIPYLFLFDSDGEDPDKKTVDLKKELSVSPSKIHVLEKYSIESYLISSPGAIASSINSDVGSVREFIDQNYYGGNPSGVLKDLYQENLGTGYNKEHNGAQIVRHFEESDIEEEIEDLINSLISMS